MSVCPKEKSDIPEPRQGSASRIPSPAFNIRSLRGVDKNRPGPAAAASNFFQHQFGLIFFPPRIRTGDGAGYGAMVGAAGEVVEKISTGASTLVTSLGQHI